MCNIDLCYSYFEVKENNNIINDNSLNIGLGLTPDFYIKQRKNRDTIPRSFKIKKFLIGDILEFVYCYKHVSLTFSGICIAVKKKSFVIPDLTLILRNIVIKTGIEVTLSYFYNRAYKLKFLDYKRKFYTFNKNKLYFIRDRLNKESRVN